MKKDYENPTLEVSLFSVEEVLTTSGEGWKPGDNEGGRD